MKTTLKVIDIIEKDIAVSTDDDLDLVNNFVIPTAKKYFAKTLQEENYTMENNAELLKVSWIDDEWIEV